MDERKDLNFNPEEKGLAYLDDLTGLYNRRYLYENLPKLLADAKAHNGFLALAMMDVDKFKQINDHYGHLSGDRVLSNTADVLRKSFRAEDIVIRYAGDEFIVIMPGLGFEDANILTKKFVERVANQSVEGKDGQPDISITMSAGLANFPEDADLLEEIISKADAALYAAKRGGRNRVCLFKNIPSDIYQETLIRQLFPSKIIIGRETELATLDDLFSQGLTGKAQMIIVEGVEGIGKTRLLQEFRSHLTKQKFNSFTMRCTEESSSQPYNILSVSLKRYFSSHEDEIEQLVRFLPEAEMRQVASQVPFFKEYLKQVPEKPKDKLNEVDILKGLYKSFLFVSKGGCLVLFIDDINWIDIATLQIVNYMLRNLKAMPIFIVGALTPHEMTRRQAAEDSAMKMFEAMEKDGLTNRISLKELNLSQLGQFISVIFSGLQISAELTQTIFNLTKGNPFYAEELLRLLAEKGLFYFRNNQWLSKDIKASDLPAVLKDIVRSHIEALDTEARQIIEAATIIGQEFNLDTLASLVDREPVFVLDAIDRARNVRIIAEGDELKAEEFKFANAMSRQILYDLMSEEKRRNLHMKLALIEEERYKDSINNIAGTLHYHYTKAKATERASVYDALVKDRIRALPSYDQLMKFLQETLLEKLEEVELPLSDESFMAVPGLILSFHLTVQNVRLYPPHSGMSRSFVERVFNELQKIFKRDEKISFATLEGKILVNGEEIKNKDFRAASGGSFVNILVEHRIKNLIFKKGLTVEELTTFFETIGEKYEKLMKKGGISEVLKEAGSTHVSVNEVRYEVLTKGKQQRRQLEDALLVDYLLGKVSSQGLQNQNLIAEIGNDPQRLADLMMNALDKMSLAPGGKGKQDNTSEVLGKSIERLTQDLAKRGPDELEKYKKKIALAMNFLSPDVLSGILKRGLPEDDNATHQVMAEIIANLPEEAIVDSAVNFAFRRGGSLKDLKKVIQVQLGESKNKNTTLALINEKLKNAGVEGDAFPWLLEEFDWQKLSEKDKVEQILKTSPKVYYQLGLSDSALELAQGLISKNDDQQVLKILLKLFADLDHPEEEVRRFFAEEIFRFWQIVYKEKREKVHEEIISRIFALIETEKDGEKFSLIFPILQRIIFQFIEGGDYTLLHSLLARLKKLSESEKTDEFKRQQLSQFWAMLENARQGNRLLNLVVDKIEKGKKGEDLELLVKWAGLSDEAKIEEIANIPIAIYFELALSSFALELFSQLIVKQQQVLAEKLLAVLKAKAESAEQEERLKLLKDYAILGKTALVKKELAFSEAVVSGLVDFMDKEKYQPSLEFIASKLEEIFKESLKEKQYPLANQILDSIKKRMAPSAVSDEAKRYLLLNLWQKISKSDSATLILNTVKERLRRGEDIHDLQGLVSSLSKEILLPVIELVIQERVEDDSFYAYSLRWNACKIFRQMSQEVSTLLIERLKRETDASVIENIIEILGILREKETVSTLGAMAFYPDIKIRKEAILALTKIGNEPAKDAIYALITDKDIEARLSAIWSLVNLGDKRVIPALNSLLKDKQYQKRAESALEKLQKRG
jgi:diguanylate cyclase (GGDEF)-like protein